MKKQIKKAFTFSCKTFRSDLWFAILRSRKTKSSQTKLHSYGFTLAEVLITLTILGVVAAISIPSVMRTQNEAAERTKLKKAIVDYEKLIPNMTIENNLTSIEALKDYANKDNCVKSRTYFKIKQDDTSSSANNCIFQTSNGVWWNVTDITRPVISTKGVENLSTADGKNSFLLSTTYSDTARAFIVDDLSSSQLTDEEKAQLKKTLAFTKINNETNASSTNKDCTIEACTEQEKYSAGLFDSQCDVGEHISCSNPQSDVESQTVYFTDPEHGQCNCNPGYGIVVYDSNGERIDVKNGNCFDYPVPYTCTDGYTYSNVP